MDKIKEVEIGYIEPGHEVKGKKIWPNKELDVKEMYGAHKKELSIFGALKKSALQLLSREESGRVHLNKAKVEPASMNRTAL